VQLRRVSDTTAGMGAPMSGSPQLPPTPKAQTSLEEATRIARHYIGGRLSELRPPRDGYGWIVCTLPEFFPGATWSAMPALFVEGATPEEAAREAAAQLRAAGWTPTHARLEWEDCGSDVVHLRFKVDNARLHVATCRHAYRYYYTVEIFAKAGKPAPKDRHLTKESRWSAVAEWCRETFPNYYLPPFPETPSARS